MSNSRMNNFRATNYFEVRKRNRTVCTTIIMIVTILVTIGSRADETKISFLNDRQWDGSAAGLLMALDNQYYSEGGLNVTMDPGKSSLDTLARVESGEYDFGSVDINRLIIHKDKYPESQLDAIYVIENSSALAIVGRRSLGVVGPNDLEGHRLSVPIVGDAYTKWSAFTHTLDIDEIFVNLEPLGVGERETMLAKGDVDAIAGTSYLMMPNLQSIGVTVEDTSLMLMSDFGLDLYGNVIIVNPEFATNNPDTVSAFINASTQGILDTIADPTKAVKHVISHNESAVEATELSRLIMAIGYHIVTDEVREHGLGALQPGRLEKSIEQFSKGYWFTNRPSAGDLFDETYLPSIAKRQIVD